MRKDWLAARTSLRSLGIRRYFRNGVIEGAADLPTGDGQASRFVGVQFVPLVVNRVKQCLNIVEHYDMGLPAYVFLSLCSVSKTVYRYAGPGGVFQETEPLGREITVLPVIYVDGFDIDATKAMRPAFNVLWNAFGQYHCDVYDADGNIPQS